MSIYKEYGWEDDQFTNAHSYILPVLLESLEDTDEPILDIGCGNGAVANYLIDKGFDMYGTDASEKGISVANKKNPGRFFVQDLTKDSLPDKLSVLDFKTIISTEVIEHLYDPRGYIQFCRNILKENAKGSRFIITTPYHGYLKNVVLALSGKMDQHFTVLWDGGHIKFWSYKTIKKLLNEYDFEIVDFKGAGRLPYLWKSMVVSATLRV